MGLDVFLKTSHQLCDYSIIQKRTPTGVIFNKYNISIPTNDKLLSGNDENNYINTKQWLCQKIDYNII